MGARALMRGARLGSLALATALAACGARPAPPPAHPPPAPLGAPRVVQGSLAASPVLGDLPKRASEAGAGPLATVVSGPLTEGERAGAFVEVPPGVCLLAYARASASLVDIDVAAFSDEGNPVAVDEGPDARPTVLVCPPHPPRVYLAVHAASGEGLAVVGAQLVPRDKAAQVAKAAHARGALGGPPKTPEAWPGLDAAVRDHRAAVGGKWQEQRRVAVAADARAKSAVAFEVEEGGCTDALVVPDDDVAVLDVDVIDAEGRLVARAKSGGASRSITVCSPVALAGSLEVRPHVGRGLVAVVVARAARESVRDVGARPEIAWYASARPVATARAEREAALTRAGYARATTSRTGALQLGRRATVPLTLPGGCARVDVVAGAPLALVDGAVWDDAGALLATGSGASGVTLFACGRGKARVDLGTSGRPGPYAMLVRPALWRDASFAKHPLAAGRMLARAASGPAALPEGRAESVRVATLDPAHELAWTRSIEPGACLRVAAGAEGEGTGLVVRLLDAVTGDELDRAHGQTSAGVRACAGGATRTVRIEARATAGELSAVIGERVVSSN